MAFCGSSELEALELEDVPAVRAEDEGFWMMLAPRLKCLNQATSEHVSECFSEFLYVYIYIYIQIYLYVCILYVCICIFFYILYTHVYIYIYTYSYEAFVCLI